MPNAIPAPSQQRLKSKPKGYNATLTQSGTSDPVATVLDTDFNTITWARTGVGTYTGTLTAAFPNGAKVILDVTNTTSILNGYIIDVLTANSVRIRTYVLPSTLTDGLMGSTPVQILVYP